MYSGDEWYPDDVTSGPDRDEIGTEFDHERSLIEAEYDEYPQGESR